MDDETIFREYILRNPGCGKPVDPKTIPLDGSTPISRRVRVAQNCIAATKGSPPLLPDIYFGVVDSPYLDAFAFTDQNRSFIAYATGTDQVLAVVFNRILADRDLLTHIGHHEGEADGGALPILSSLIRPGSANLTPLILAATDQPTIPRDPVRASFAWCLQQYAGLYIVLHEIAHIAQGVTAFNEACGAKGREMHEVVGESKELVRQAIELYADQASVQMAMQALHHSAIALPVAPTGELSMDPQDALYAWLFALYVLCRLFGDDRIGASSLGKLYPPWRLRQLAMLEAIVDQAVDHTSGIFGSRLEVLAISQRVWSDSAEAMSRVTGQPRTPNMALSFTDPDVRRRKEELRELWKKVVRGHLVGHSRVPLPDGLASDQPPARARLRSGSGHVGVAMVPPPRLSPEWVTNGERLRLGYGPESSDGVALEVFKTEAGFLEVRVFDPEFSLTFSPIPLPAITQAGFQVVAVWDNGAVNLFVADRLVGMAKPP